MSSNVDVIATGTEDTVLSKNEKKIKPNIPVSKLSAMAKGYLRYINEQDDEDDEQARQDLYNLMERFTNQTEQSGDANDFHNFSVALAVKDEYALACDVLECGLKLHPKDVDLLADYIEYGLNCGRVEEVKNSYKILISTPRTIWTWRAFAFSIGYLKNNILRSDSQQEIDLIFKNIQDMLSDFRKYHSSSEEPYRVEAEIYQSINKNKEEKEVLKSALDNLKVAPKCALRYAYLLFEDGEYEEATAAIKRCIGDSTGIQSSVNEGYMYYIYALSILADYQKGGITMDKDTVIQIYSNFNIALFDLRNSNYSGVIRTKTNMLINTTGIEIPAEFENLRDCAL